MAAGITIEDLARASASYDVDGALAAFDEGAARGEVSGQGKFVEHVTRTEWLIIRATEYAQERQAKR